MGLEPRRSLFAAQLGVKELEFPDRRALGRVEDVESDIAAADRGESDRHHPDEPVVFEVTQTRRTGEKEAVPYCAG